MSGEEEPVDAEVPEPVVVFEGQVPVYDADLRIEHRASYRVVATFHLQAPPGEETGWYVTVERLDHDALARPRWLSVDRLPYLGEASEVSDEYARVLETALAATGERMNKVREKLEEKK